MKECRRCSSSGVLLPLKENNQLGNLPHLHWNAVKIITISIQRIGRPIVSTSLIDVLKNLVQVRPIKHYTCYSQFKVTRASDMFKLKMITMIMI